MPADGSRAKLLHPPGERFEPGSTDWGVSDDSDDNGAHRLVLGSHQCVLPREGGVEYLTLCHHPLQWLLDGDEVERALNARARIQLYGHKHAQTADRINNSVRVTAGSVHPDRADANWRPRYNCIAVSVSGEGRGRTLEVTLYPRVWLDDAKRFGPDHDYYGSDFRHHSLPIEAWVPTSPRLTVCAAGAAQEETTPVVTEELTMVRSDGEGNQPTINRRKLAYRFLSLPYHERIAVAQELDLLRDEDRGLRDVELFQRVFQRAKEESMIDRLWDAVERRYGR